MKTAEHYSLLHHNTFGIDQQCDVFVEWESEADAVAVARQLRDSHKPYLLLGGGSNLLLTDDFHGTVVTPARRFDLSVIMSYDDNVPSLRCWAGTTFDDVVDYAVRHGYYGQMDWLIVEASDIEEFDDECHLSLTSAGGIVTTAARLAKRVIIELNHFHSPRSRMLHDTYEPGECGFGRKPIPIINVLDRIGNNYVTIDAKKIVGVVECKIPEEARTFKALTPTTLQMGNNVAEFLVADMKAGHIPPQFLPIQSGVGATGNAVLAAMGKNPHIPSFQVYSEVVQDAAIDLIEKGQIKAASATAMTVTNEALQHVYYNINFFAKHLVIRQSEIANSPEIIRRLGCIAINTAIECDIYGNENSSHICASRLMNGIGGSCDYERNGYISIFTTPSTAKDGKISAIVPFCSHIDSTEHDVDVIVTEQGVADLRGKGPLHRAHEIIENCAHPDYKPLLREYLKIAEKGHTPHSLRAAFALHDTFERKGDMRLTDFGEYL